MINNEEEYNKALLRLEEIFDSEPGTSEYKELGKLAKDVCDYEEIYFNLQEPTREDTYEYFIEQRGMSKEESLVRSYFEDKEIHDINQSEVVEVLPLTLVDMLLEYKELCVKTINYET